MVTIGRTLIMIAFLVGAVAAVLSVETVRWPVFIVAMVCGLMGVVLVRMGTKAHATHEERLKANIEAIAASLDTLAERSNQFAGDYLAAYNKHKESSGPIDVYGVHRTIDQLFPEPLDRFVTARESLIHYFTMQDYAEIMNHFAAGERGINRVWSASVDGYVDEIAIHVEKAAVHFKEAAEVFRDLQKAKTGAGAA